MEHFICVTFHMCCISYVLLFHWNIFNSLGHKVFQTSGRRRNGLVHVFKMPSTPFNTPTAFLQARARRGRGSTLQGAPLRQGRMAAALPIFTCNWCSLLRDYMLYMLKIYCAIRIPSIWLAFIDLPSFALDALVAFRILSIILYLRAEVSETGKMD